MTIQVLIEKVINQILSPLVVLLFGAGLVLFLWGVVNYVIGAQGNETKLKQGKQAIIWGIVGMTIMASAWGLIAMLCSFFETCKGIPIAPPPFGTSPYSPSSSSGTGGPSGSYPLDEFQPF